MQEESVSWSQMFADAFSKRWKTEPNFLRPPLKREAATKASVDIKKRKEPKDTLNVAIERVFKPRNALSIISELHSKSVFSVQMDTESRPSETTIPCSALLNVNERMYWGDGWTVTGAKVMAAEAALKDLYEKPMTSADEGILGTVVGREMLVSYAMHQLLKRWQISTSSTDHSQSVSWPSPSLPLQRPHPSASSPSGSIPQEINVRAPATMVTHQQL